MAPKTTRRPFRLAVLGLAMLSGCPDEASSDNDTESAESGSTAAATAASDSQAGADGSSGRASTGDIADDSTSASPDSTGDDDDGASSSGTSGQDSACVAMGGTCTRDFPKGWVGPVAMVQWDDGERDVECDGAYPIPLAMSLSHEIVASPATCECSCGAPTGGDCTGEVTLVEAVLLQDDACFPALGSPVLDTLDVGETGSFSLEGSSFGILVNVTEAPTYSGGSCNDTASVIVSPPSFANHVALCGSEAIDAACEVDTLCMPTPQAPEAAAVCVWQEGEHSCPSGWGYADRTLLFGDLEDTRGCSDCGCGTPAGPCSPGEVEISGTFFDGKADTSDTVMAGDCSSWTLAGGEATSATWTTGPAAAAGCAPIGGNPNGDVVGELPVTLCCYDL